MKTNRNQMWDQYALSAMRAQHDGNYQQAECMWFAAVEESIDFGETDSRMICSLEYLSQVYWLQQKYEEAEDVCVRLLAIYERLCGPFHQSVGVIVNNLAIVSHALGKPAMAKQLYKRALSIKVKTLSPDHPEIVSLLDNYAKLAHAVQGEPAQKNWMKSQARLPLRAGAGQTGEEPVQMYEPLSPSIVVDIEAKPLFHKLVAFNKACLQHAS